MKKNFNVAPISRKEVNVTVTHFFWKGNNLSYELDSSFQPARRYIFGTGKDRIEGHVEFSEVSGNLFDVSKKGWYSYVKDQVGTVYKVYSDSTRQMAETRTYDTFGNLIHQTGSSGGNLGFQGKYFDQESGLYYFFHRYYHPSNGRFLNEDPIGLIGGLNHFRFVKNNPIQKTDPFGLLTGKMKIVDIPCNNYENLGNNAQRNGKTDTSFEISAKCVCIDGKWHPRFHFSLTMKVYHIEESAREHEYRHVGDIEYAYNRIKKMLIQVESLQQFSRSSCINAGSAFTLITILYL